jgi:hypothetical protein
MTTGTNAAAADLAVVLSADTTELKRALGRAGRAVSKADLQVARATRRMQSQFDTAGASAARMGGRFSRVFSGRLGNNIQNVGFQVGDFATQVGAGTSAMRAFSMQAPQLLGAFGPQGAILGVVAGVAGSLAASLWDTGDAAEDTGRKFEDLVAPLDTIEDGLDDLRSIADKYAAAIEGTADSQDAATQRNIANIRREFNARRDLLALEANVARLKQLGRRSELQRKQGALDRARDLQERRDALEAEAAGMRPGRARTRVLGEARQLEEGIEATLSGAGDDVDSILDLRTEVAQLRVAIAEGKATIGAYLDARQGGIADPNRGVGDVAGDGGGDGDGSGGSGGSRGGGSTTPRPGPRSMDTGFRGLATINTPEYQLQRRVNDYFAAQDQVRRGQQEVADAAQFAGQALSKAAQSALTSSDSFKEAAGNFLQSLAGSLTSKLASVGGDMLAGGISDALAGGATGGTFKVAGSGSTDSKIASMRVSPGELVQVKQPARAGGDGAPTNVYQIDARGADQGVVQRLEAWAAQHEASHPARVAADVKKGQAERTLSRGKGKR